MQIPPTTFWLEQIGLDPDLARKLTFRSGETFIPLPDWAWFYIWLGWHARMNINDRERWISVVLCPNRNFASLFCGVGIVLAAAFEKITNPHWELLCSKSIGSQCWVTHTDGRPYRATLDDIVTRDRSPLIFKLRYTVEARRNQPVSPTVVDIKRHNVFRVSFSETEPPRRRSSHRILQKCIPDLPDSWLNEKTVEAVLVGNVLSLDKAVKEKIKLDTVEGCLDDLLLPCKQNTAAGRIRFWSNQGQHDSSSFPVAIFDGSKAYQNHSSPFISSNWVVFLEYDEAQNVSGSLIDQFYAASQRYYPSEPIAGHTSLPLPAGIDFLTFPVPKN